MAKSTYAFQLRIDEVLYKALKREQERLEKALGTKISMQQTIRMVLYQGVQEQEEKRYHGRTHQRKRGKGE